MRIILLADAGPLFTLAYADALDVLFKLGWSVKLVDMVQFEVTRNQTPTNEKINAWIKQNDIQILESTIFQRYQKALNGGKNPRKNNLSELATQEIMNGLVLQEPPQTGLFLFEDHRVARTSFVLPDNCRKISTHAFLSFLEQHNWIQSAYEIEQKAIQAGRGFSQLRYQS